MLADIVFIPHEISDVFIIQKVLSAFNTLYTSYSTF